MNVKRHILDAIEDASLRLTSWQLD